MSNTLSNLLYWKWMSAFYFAVGPKQVYEAPQLRKKLEDVIFFKNLEAEVYPSYHFWILIYQMLLNFPHKYKEKPSAYHLEKFSVSEEDFLREGLFDILICFKYFPIVFRDLYLFYPKFNLKFDDLELTYLDFWSQTPKVLSSLLSELLVRDVPFREPYFDNLMWKDKALPPLKASLYSTEKLHAHIIDYFLGEGTDPAFLTIITFYLNSRISIKQACSQDLQAKGLDVNDLSLAEYFLGYYIFKDVSNEALRFCVANTDLLTKDPLKVRREGWIVEWNAFPQETRQMVIGWSKKAIENTIARHKFFANMTHEERIARREALLKTPIDESKILVVPNSWITGLPKR